MLNVVVLIRVRLVMGRLLVAVAHHGLEPNGLPLQVLGGRDLATEDAVVAILLQLPSEDQAGAKEGEDIEIVQQDGDTHILAEDFHSLDVGERTGSHAKGYEVQRAGHCVGDHDIRVGISNPVFEWQAFSGTAPTGQEFENAFCSMT